MSSGSQKRGKGRYEKLEAELERSNQDYIDNSQHQQQVTTPTHYMTTPINTVDVTGANGDAR